MSVVEINIRQIQKSDNLKVKEIIINSLEEYGANREGFAAKDPELDDLTSFYANKKGFYYVATINKMIVGGAGIAELKGDHSIWELQKMYLSAEVRGKGIGKLLMEKCIETANTNYINQLYIETLDSMKEANKLYLKYGFEEIEQPKGDSGHFGCDKFYILNLNG
jgi:putative acetyltransferase